MLESPETRAVRAWWAGSCTGTPELIVFVDDLVVGVLVEQLKLLEAQRVQQPHQVLLLHVCAFLHAQEQRGMPCTLVRLACPCALRVCAPALHVCVTG